MGVTNIEKIRKASIEDIAEIFSKISGEGEGTSFLDDYYCNTLCEYTVDGKCTTDRCIDLTYKDLVKSWLEAEAE